MNFCIHCDASQPSSATNWGRWRYDTDAKAIYDDSPSRYWVPLTGAIDAAWLAKWTMHLDEKRWLSPVDVDDFRRAVKAITGIGDD